MNAGNKQKESGDTIDAGILLCLIIQRAHDIWSFVDRFPKLKPEALTTPEMEYLVVSINLRSQCRLSVFVHQGSTVYTARTVVLAPFSIDPACNRISLARRLSLEDQFDASLSPRVHRIKRRS